MPDDDESKPFRFSETGRVEFKPRNALNFEASVPPPVRDYAQRARLDAHRLGDVYRRAWAKRYGIEPVVDDAGVIILEGLQKLVPSLAAEIVEHYIKMNDEWFVKRAHDIPTLKGSLNRVMASLGMEKRAKAQDSNLMIMDEVDRFIHYAFDTPIRDFLFKWKIFPTGRTTLASGEIGPEGKVVFNDAYTKEFTKDEAQEMLLHLRGRGLDLMDVKEAFIAAISPWKKTPPEENTSCDPPAA